MVDLDSFGGCLREACIMLYNKTPERRLNSKTYRHRGCTKSQISRNNPRRCSR
jgi:hypothetical protein